jgi:hypothetical protein
MLLEPNRRRTRRRTSSVKRGVSWKDYCSHIKLDGWKNAYLSANSDVIPFEGRGRKPAAELSDNQCLGFLHRLKGYILAPVAVFTFGRLAELFPCWRDLRPGNNWNYWNGWNHWDKLLLGVRMRFNARNDDGIMWCFLLVPHCGQSCSRL